MNKRSARIMLAIALCVLSMGCAKRPAEEAADSVSAYIPPAMAEWGAHTTPSLGELRVPVFMIEFQDAVFGENSMLGEELEQAIFSQDQKNSMTCFYDRASYGNLQISGELFSYTAQKEIADYETEEGYEELSMEVLCAFDDQIDYTDYDQDQDGIIDAYILCVPPGGDVDFWYGCQATWYQHRKFEVDGVKPLYYVICDSQPDRSDMEYFMETLQHELGHCMGLPDYYKYYSEDDEGLNGLAGYEMMDDMLGDFSQFSKLQLGWLRSDQVQVYGYGQEEEFILPSSQKGGCIVIFPGKFGERGYQSEYFVVEYNTPEGNFEGLFDEEEAGVRILHVQAEYAPSAANVFYRYENFGDDYDTSETGIRFVRLVNDGNGYYQAGDSVTLGEAGMEWYPSKRQIRPFTLMVQECDGDVARVVITAE